MDGHDIELDAYKKKKKISHLSITLNLWFGSFSCIIKQTKKYTSSKPPKPRQHGTVFNIVNKSDYILNIGVCWLAFFFPLSPNHQSATQFGETLAQWEHRDRFYRLTPTPKCMFASGRFSGLNCFLAAVKAPSTLAEHFWLPSFLFQCFYDVIMLCLFQTATISFAKTHQKKKNSTMPFVFIAPS